MSMFKRERLAQVEAKTASDQPKHTVLIVDDEDGNLRALRSVLGNDFNILEAKDGQAALELLQSLPADQAPAVILSDQRMPRMTGVELFAHLRASSSPDSSTSAPSSRRSTVPASTSSWSSPTTRNSCA